MANDIFVILEHTNGQLRKVSLELLSEGRRLADRTGEVVSAVLLGTGVGELIPVVAAYGADQVILAEAPALENYSTGAYTSVLNKVIREHQPKLVLLGHTVLGKDLAPRLAQRLGVGLVSDCVGMEQDDNYFVKFTRPIYAGKAFSHIHTEVTPIITTIRPNTFTLADPAQDRSAKVIETAVNIDPADLRAIIREVVRAASSRPELTDANIIVSAGRGIKSAENFRVVDELADVLGAAVGASRAAVDSGYREYKYQVGQTGKTVSPTLYIACGISGAIQHLAGMGSSKVIVAINKDPEANIFAVADYGIVGDLFEIVPLLTHEFKQRLA
ncbi:MAG: electron transfer flavoprotein subunit alpha/FixB family protein [Peptococcaceae bacterium]|nr:electron transfer flavoprotein subunit alpha/FixB family protein [Peptococcaceae bacterium]